MQSTVHAESSAKKFGGKAEDYLAIHVFLDSSKAQMNDARHRALTHNSWFIREVVPRIFGQTLKNSEGKTVSVVDIVEQHVLEDYGMLFVPTPQDFLAEMDLTDWMDNARDKATPPSRQKVRGRKRVVVPALQADFSVPTSFAKRPCARAGRGVLD